MSEVYVALRGYERHFGDPSHLRDLARKGLGLYVRLKDYVVSDGYEPAVARGLDVEEVRPLRELRELFEIPFVALVPVVLEARMNSLL